MCCPAHHDNTRINPYSPTILCMESRGDILVIHRIRFWGDDFVFLRPLDLSYTPVAVSWRPAEVGLHYHGLYRGIYEWLRAPPRAEFRGRAEEYLVALGDGQFGGQLQRDRIRWTRAWLRELDGEECWSDAETVAHEED